MSDLWHWLPIPMYPGDVETFEERMRRRWKGDELILEELDYMFIRSDHESALVMIALIMRGEPDCVIADNFIAFDIHAPVASRVKPLLEQLADQIEREFFTIVRAGFRNERDRDLLRAELDIMVSV